jgi:hypothetical protein
MRRVNNGYFEQMSDLMLNKKLLTSKKGDAAAAARQVARTSPSPPFAA